MARATGGRFVSIQTDLQTDRGERMRELRLAAATVSCASALLLSAVLAAAGAPTLRLPPDVRPLAESVELVLDPASDGFSGSVLVDLDVARPTAVVWLNATRLSFASASLGNGRRLRPARVVPGSESVVGFAADPPLDRGRATLRAAFSGPVSRLARDGVFSVHERGDWYLFTQFEPIAARRAFPCFDEPSYKIPWTLTLRVPRGMVALSNTAPAATGRDGPRDVTAFATTPPLPSYLVAFAVGPFDLVDTGRAGRRHTPTRLVVPRGRASETSWARESTPRILRLLEDYFDRPYPFEKLDQLAIPGVDFAMEHPGLVTYGADLLLQGTGEASDARSAWVSVCAHELAHQWLGNLVTMAWWDDTWLNEALASWLGEKVHDRFRPDWKTALDRVAARDGALDADSLASARRVRQPIASEDDIESAFDGITYSKGEAVLEMTEAWLGAETMRRGVRSYVNAHAGGTATATDFISALSKAASLDAGPVLSSFLEQPGAPEVRAELRCGASPELLLSQSPYRALGSPDGGSRTWHVPVCVRTESGRRCTVLDAPTGIVSLGRGTCSAWLYANADAAGYFRTVLRPGEAGLLLEGGRLDAAERVALAGDIAALAASGSVSAADALEVAPLLARDPDRHVVEAAVALLERLGRLVPDALVPEFRSYAARALGERASALGWTSRPGDGSDERLLRRTLVPAAVRLGRLDGLARDAVRRTWDWLDRRAPADPDTLDAMVAAAAGSGDRALFERLRSEMLRSSDRALRERMLGGIAGVHEPELAAEALELTLDERLDPREAARLLLALGSRRETGRLTLDFLDAHATALVARLPRESLSSVSALPWIGASVCTPAARSQVEALFRPRLASMGIGPRGLRQALEGIDQCVAQRQAQLPSLVAFLQRHSHARAADPASPPTPRGPAYGPPDGTRPRARREASADGPAVSPAPPASPPAP